MNSCKDFVVQNILSCPLKKHNFIKALKHNYYHIFLVKLYFGYLLIGWVTNVCSNLGGKIEEKKKANQELFWGLPGICRP